MLLLKQYIIGERNGISVERVRQIVASIGRRCRYHVVINKLTHPDNWDDCNYDYFVNNKYWLGILSQCEGPLKLLTSGTLETPLRLTVMNPTLYNAMHEIGVVTVGELYDQIKNNRAAIVRIFKGNTAEVKRLLKWIEEYTAV